MRDYLSTSNLGKALLLSALCTLASMPRIIQGGFSLWFYIPASFVSLTLIGGAATAWGKCAGMVGFWPDRRKQFRGATLAILAALALWPVALKFDPIVRAAFAAGDDSRALLLQYPDSPTGVASLILWAVGFELLFFIVASAAFFGRLSGRMWLAVVGPALVRVLIAHYQLTAGNITDNVPLILFAAGAMTGASCLLFPNFGIVSTILFVAVLDARLFFMMRG